jgi:fructose-bisphosphate aldolase class II
MVDMSHYDEKENLEKTKILAKECHDKGIAVEAESGRIEGGEDGIADTGDLEGTYLPHQIFKVECWGDAALFTSPQDVDNFIAANIDILAPSIGNIHGDYGPAGPKPGQLNFDRLSAINEQVNNRVWIALHGTNDFPPELMKKCIEKGAIKLNVNKLLLEVWNEHLRKHAASTPLVRFIDEGMDVLQKETERWMDICESSGKAWVD